MTPTCIQLYNVRRIWYKCDFELWVKHRKSRCLRYRKSLSANEAVPFSCSGSLSRNLDGDGSSETQGYDNRNNRKSSPTHSSGHSSAGSLGGSFGDSDDEDLPPFNFDNFDKEGILSNSSREYSILSEWLLCKTEVQTHKKRLYFPCICHFIPSVINWNRSFPRIYFRFFWKSVEFDKHYISKSIVLQKGLKIRILAMLKCKNSRSMFITHSYYYISKNVSKFKYKPIPDLSIGSDEDPVHSSIQIQGIFNKVCAEMLGDEYFGEDNDNYFCEEEPSEFKVRKNATTTSLE